MQATRRLIGIGTALLVVVGALAPGTASAARQKYRYSFTKTLHVDWQWPVNPNNRGRRDSQAYEVTSGKGCGTSPSRAVWKVVYRTPDSGLPAATLKIDLIHVPKNPAKVLDANYGGEPAADVQIYLKFNPTNVTMSAIPHGDVVGLEFVPASRKVAITKRKVRRC
jgi:hypothetical protein